MSKEGSVAPKERVNIVYRPATGDAKEEVELPLKLMVLGDFTQREDDRPLEDRDPVSVDKNNFNDVMKGQGLGMTISVPNKLADDDPDARLAVERHRDGRRGNSQFLSDVLGCDICHGPHLLCFLHCNIPAAGTQGPEAMTD